jgi:hypothetical protein
VLESWQVVDLLTHLVDKNLAVYEEDGHGQGRYRLLETVRQYAREKMMDSGEGDVMQRRHGDWFVRFAEQMEPRLHGAQQVAALDRLEQEHDNLRAALAWSREADPTADQMMDEPMLRLAGALPWFWLMGGYEGEGLAWLALALEQQALEQTSERGGASPARATALKGAGQLAYTQGDYVAALAYLEESVALWQQIGDKGRRLADAIVQLGPAAAGAGRGTPRHGELTREGIALARASGDKWVLARLLFPSAVGSTQAGNFETAVPLLEECAALWREVGDAWGLAGPLEYLGAIRASQGDPAAGRALLEEGLALARRVGGPWKVSQLLDTLGEVALMEGDIAGARPLIEESLALCRRMNNKTRIAYELCNLGHVARREADFGQARALYRESLALYRALDGEGGGGNKLSKLLDGFARLAAAEAKPLRAARLFGASEARQYSAGALERADHDRAIAATRAALDEKAFAAAQAEGQAMSLEQAVAYALEEIHTGGSEVYQPSPPCQPSHSKGKQPA